MSLIADFRANLGKSKGSQSLYEHTFQCLYVMNALLSEPRFTPPSYPAWRRDTLIFSMLVHDIGKLDSHFQAMLRESAAAKREGRDPDFTGIKKVKHEASTLDFAQRVSDGFEEGRDHLRQAFGYRLEQVPPLDDVLAFCLTHHGLFYLSFEERNGQRLHRVRREWTVFNPGETSRITLADLLFEYHPLGGLVILCDLLGSFWHEQSLTNLDTHLGEAQSVRELIDRLLLPHAEELEQSIAQYDPRTYGLRDILHLLAGGLE